MAASRGHGKGGRPGAGRGESDGPALLVTRTERIESFLYEWGRLVVPIVVFGALAILYYAGVIDALALGYAIGMVVLLTMPVAVAIIVLRGYFPAWARIVTIVMTVVYLAGSIWPLTNMVYPGDPEFSQDLTIDAGEVTVPVETTAGYYWVEVFAKSFSKVAGVRNEQGRYSVMIDGQRLQGEFSDMPLPSALGSHDGTTVSHLKVLRLGDGPLKVRATRIEKAVGPEVTISGYRMAASPLIFIFMLGAVLLWSVFVDSWFQNQTWRWRLAPWVGVSIVYIAFFYRTWEPVRMPSISVWAAVIGGLGGFLLGWLLSLIVRRVIGRLRTKF